MSIRGVTLLHSRHLAHLFINAAMSVVSVPLPRHSLSPSLLLQQRFSSAVTNLSRRVRQSPIVVAASPSARVWPSSASRVFSIRDLTLLVSRIGGSLHEECGDRSTWNSSCRDRVTERRNSRRNAGVGSGYFSACDFAEKRMRRDLGNGGHMVVSRRAFAEDGKGTDVPLMDLEKEKFKEVTIEPTNKLFTLPTILTLARVAAVPAILAVYYSNQSWATAAGVGIFVFAAVTDWLDGYLARKMGTSSAFGAFLDPVADKLMVATALVLLCTKPLAITELAAIPWLLPVPTIAIVGREITMSAVREWAATQGGDLHKAVAVNSFGKIKTASQMVSITLLLASGEGGLDSRIVGVLGVSLLYVAAILALWSLGMYMRGIKGSLFK